MTITDALTRPALDRGFTSDNTAGAAPQILTAVAAAATGQALPYGRDELTAAMRRRFNEIFERDVDVLPVSTGSAANALAVAAMTPPWGSVLSHPGAHINHDECGAPEFFTNGAKLVAVDGPDTRIDPGDLQTAVRRKIGDMHSVQPSVVSLTQATETGTIYPLAHVRELADIAHHAGLGVHMDGARFANAVAALGVTPADMTWRAGIDVLSFGATKNGAMTADALVVFDRSLTGQLEFRTKRAGQLTAKMRFQAAQLDAYLTDNLWLRNAAHANAMAARLTDGLRAIPAIRLLGTPEANIVFADIPAAVTQDLLNQGFSFYHDRWAPETVRFVTSFTTTTKDIDDLIHAIGTSAGS
jgi:threonine aldolase